MYVSLSSLLPVITGLVDNVKPAAGDNSTIKQFKTTVCKQLHERFPQVNPPKWIIVALKASLLDPRFHSLSFMPESVVADVKARILVEMEQLAQVPVSADGDPGHPEIRETGNATQKQKERAAEDALFSHMIFGNNSSNSSAQGTQEDDATNELNRFLAQPTRQR